MDRLIACSGCARHVRATESECPFCHGALEAPPEAALVAPAGRLGRAAIFAFGAALAATTVSSCIAAYGAPSDYDAGTDAGPVAPAYGGPAADGG